jgi:hypothetical protein
LPFALIQQAAELMTVNEETKMERYYRRVIMGSFFTIAIVSFAHTDLASAKVLSLPGFKLNVVQHDSKSGEHGDFNLGQTSPKFLSSSVTVRLEVKAWRRTGAVRTMLHDGVESYDQIIGEYKGSGADRIEIPDISVNFNFYAIESLTFKIEGSDCDQTNVYVEGISEDHYLEKYGLVDIEKQLGEAGKVAPPIVGASYRHNVWQDQFGKFDKISIICEKYR